MPDHALIKDTFTDTPGTLIESHTPELGGPWTQITGEGGASIDASGTKCEGDSIYVLSLGSLVTGDCYLQARLSSSSPTPNQLMGIFARSDIYTSNFTAIVHPAGGGDYLTYYADHFPVFPGLYVPGDLHRLECIGNVVNFYINGSLVNSDTINTIPNPGYFGFFFASGFGDILIDDFEAGDFNNPEVVVPLDYSWQIFAGKELGYSWRVFPVDPLYSFKQENRQKSFSATILDKLITDLKPSEWIPPESH
jgi:hypothetical protein